MTLSRPWSPPLSGAPLSLLILSFSCLSVSATVSCQGSVILNLRKLTPPDGGPVLHANFARASFFRVLKLLDDFRRILNYLFRSVGWLKIRIMVWAVVRVWVLLLLPIL